jgi:hypothetical protein
MIAALGPNPIGGAQFITSIAHSSGLPDAVHIVKLAMKTASSCCSISIDMRRRPRSGTVMQNR